MRVLRLYIQECGLFEHTLIDFTHDGNAQDIVCLAGVNGTGKTTIIELIFHLILLLKPSLSPQDISYDRLKPNILTRVQFAQLDILFFDGIISLVVGEIQDIRYASIPSEKPKYNLAHRYSPDDDDLNKTLVYYDYAYQEKFESLKNWVNENILVGKSLEKIDRPNFKALIKSDKGHYHGIELLSSGEESLLIIAMQIYLKAHKNSIFIIDEIDQSLHPEFQRKMISLIGKLQKEKDCQIILSSHSEIVWRYFDKKGLIDLTQMVL